MTDQWRSGGGSFIPNIMVTYHNPPVKEENSICDLLWPPGGCFEGEVFFRSYADEPRLITRVTNSGNIAGLWDRLPRYLDGPHKGISANGSGTGLVHQDSFAPSRGEAIERYCASVYSPDQFVQASAEELGSAALDLSSIPACSSFELSNPRCPLVLPNKKAPMRWVRGLSLITGRQVYLPVVMVYIYAGFASRDEKIALPITTGCAAHSSYERALIAAILEVVERDAISITWLQSLALPRIELDAISLGLADFWAAYQRCSRELEYVFFDATTDLGFPTVYGLQISPQDPRLTTLVSCSAALDATEAVIKVIRDMAAIRIAFRPHRPAPDNWEEFTEVFHGGTFMAEGKNLGAFDFLLQSRARRSLSSMTTSPVRDEKADLQLVLHRFREKEMEVLAVDLSTDEAIRHGLRAVRVVIPALQPLSFNYQARYLGHPRLYAAPGEMGHVAKPEDQLNRWPGPFA